MPVGANSGLLINVGVNLQEFNAGMQQVEQRGQQAAASLNKIGSSLTTGAGIGAGFAAASAALSGMTGVAQAAGSAVIGLNSTLEQARIGFTAFTKDGDKANMFIKQLQQFAAQTTFEFPGLLQAARQLTGMGVQAELVIPILKDVAGAVMAVGGGEEQIKGVNRALTQMMAAGKVNAQDMNQLAQAGLPAWKMLADSMGMTIGQVRKLSEEGKITADQMLQAFHNFVQNNGLADMATKAGQTWQAAMSNIVDGLRNVAAEGFEPLFNVMRDAAVQIANFLTSDTALQFGADLKATIQEIVDMANPLRESFAKAFEAFKTDGISAALTSLLSDFKNFAGEMAGAGVSLISEFASGMLSGGMSLITDAATSIADAIASYLIGSSPPPQGPLANIVQGGQAVIEAYVQGMSQGLSGVEDIAVQITDSLGKVSGALTLEGAQQALQAAGTNMKALESAATQVEGAIRTIESALRDNQDALEATKNAATDIKDAYDAAIEPLQAQVDALKETNDLAQKQADIQSKIQLAQLKGAMQQAQGDPIRRAQLQGQLDTLEQQEKQLSLQERQLSLANQAAGLDAKARGEKRTDTGMSQQANALAQQRLGLQQKQAAIQAEMEGMVNKEAVARIKAQQTIVQTNKDQRDLNNEIKDLQNQLAAAPLEAQIKDLKAQQEALLKPIQDRIKELEREGQQLRGQKQDWQDIKAAITDTLQTQRQAAADAKKAATDAAKASKEAALSTPMDLTKIFKPEEIKASAIQAGQSWLQGMRDYLNTAGAGIVGGVLGSVLGGAMFGPLGAAAGAIFGKAFMERMQQNFGSIENIAGAVAGKISDALNIDTGKAHNAAEAFAIIWEEVRKRIALAIEQTVIDIGKLLNIDISSGATVGDRIAIIWEAMKTRVVAAITDTIAKIAEFTGVDISGATTNMEAIGLLWDALKGKVGEAVAYIKEQWTSVVTTVNSAAFQDNLSTIIGNMQKAFDLLKTAASDASTAILGLNFSGVESGAGGAATKVNDFGTALLGVSKTLASWTTGLVQILDFFVTLGKVLDDTQQMLNNTGIMLNKLVLAFVHLSTGEYDKALQDVLDFQAAQTKAHAGQDAIIKDVGDFINRIKASSQPAQAASTEVGAAVATGLEQGARQGITQAEQAGMDLGTGVVTGTQQALQTGSPSMVMVEQGTFAGEGLAQGITESTPLVLTAVTDEMVQVLAAYTDGWTQVHEQTTQQLDEIYALIQQKLTDMVGLVPPMMQQMLQEFSTGFSAIHTQMTGQLGEIYALIMMQSEQWRSAGLALGAALAEGVRSSTASIGTNTASGLRMMSLGGGGGGSIEQQIARTGMQYGGEELAKAMIALAKHETGNFESTLAREANNLFSIKGTGPAGSVTMPAWEVRGGQDVMSNETFRKYNTVAESVADFIQLISTADRYADAWASRSSATGLMQGLQRAGYATDPNWATNVLKGVDKVDVRSLMSTLPAKMSMDVDQITAGRNAGLSLEEAKAICGPYAAVLFAQATGKNPSLAEAKQLATASGWTAARGMGGTGNFMGLLGKMGINAVRQAATPENVNAALTAGNPIALSTQRHYFVGSGGTAQGGINVGATGTVMSRYGGQATMTLAEIESVGNGISDLIVLTDKLATSGEQSFNALTAGASQFGDVLTVGTEGIQTGLEGTATATAGAQQQLAATTDTLATHIQQGLVPAGLAARDAVGQMAIGIQPLISTWAQGGMTSDQLAESIVQLAAQSGLATQPLAQFAAGNASVGEALRQVMTSLAAADPAFADIQQSMSGAQVSTEQLADVLLSGLANVTGSVNIAMHALATSAAPIETAFQSGAISSEQFVQSVVELAATSGLTQAPLRMMQDGVITTNQALAQVLQTAAEVNPAFADMATSITDLPEPATEAAQAFVDWSQSMTDTAATTQENVQVITDLPTAVTDIQVPMQDAATTTMQAMPDAVTVAIDSTIQAIQAMSGPAASAAAEVGNAIVESLRAAVEAGAESISDAAVAIVEKALEAAKKAAEKVKESAKKDGNGGGGDGGDEKASGGRLSEGMWTLVGEEGPELINPSGYVYTAEETASMAADDLNAGLVALQAFAAGGKTKSTSSKSKSKSSSSKSKSKSKGNGDSSAPEAAPKKQQTPEYKEELDLQEQILKITQQKNIVALQLNPIQEKLRVALREQEKASKGTYENQQQVAANDLKIAEIDEQIAKLRFTDQGGYRAMIVMEDQMAELKKAQEEASKGDHNVQMELLGLEYKRLENEQKLAQIAYDSVNVRNQLAQKQQQYDDALKGSLSDQLKVVDLTNKQHVNQLAMNELQQKSAPLRAEAAKAQAEITKIMAGTVEQQRVLHANAQAMAQLDAQSAIEQGKLIPIQAEIATWQKTIENIQKGSLADQKAAVDAETQKAKVSLTQIGVQSQLAALQKQIEAATKGSLQDQYEAIDLQTKNAGLRIQEIKILAQLRDVDAGTLSLTQEQINALHKQLEVIDNQKAQIQDTTELKQLQAEIDTAGAQKQVLALQEQSDANQEILDTLDQQSQVQQLQAQISTTDAQKKVLDLQNQESAQQDIITALDTQHQVLQNQTDQINTQNTVSAAGQQAKLDDLNSQIAVYDAQITELQAQNDVLDLQVQNITLANQVRADALSAELVSLQEQVHQYDLQTAAVQQANNLVAAQSALLQANNAVAAAGYAAQIAQLQGIIDHRNTELERLQRQKEYLDGATTIITTHNTLSAAGHAANIISLQTQEEKQRDILGDLTAQIGALNAQKQIYKDIRDLADAIANRPPNPQPAPGGGGGGGTGGPPGNVVANATKSGEPTLYLSRGTGTDGWYTSSGQLIVQGGSANPPSGYRVKWLAEGGTWNRGEVAVLGEHGPELAIAERDMHVFPNEQSQRIARVFGGSGGGSNGGGVAAQAQRNVTVNVEYHRHSGSDYGEGTLQQIVREAVNVALRS